jgi:hypothetical protein
MIYRNNILFFYIFYNPYSIRDTEVKVQIFKIYIFYFSTLFYFLIFFLQNNYLNYKMIKTVKKVSHFFKFVR